MPQVDFYVVDSVDERAHDTLFCRLTDKALRMGHTIYLHARSARHIQQMDDLLWTFQDISFLPHAVSGARDDAPTPILIGTEDTLPPHRDLMINLGNDIPNGIEDLQRIVDTAGLNAITRENARVRYRRYQDRGYTINTHNLNR